jgi:hypothetical protein
MGRRLGLRSIIVDKHQFTHLIYSWFTPGSRLICARFAPEYPKVSSASDIDPFFTRFTPDVRPITSDLHLLYTFGPEGFKSLHRAVESRIPSHPSLAG